MKTKLFMSKYQSQIYYTNHFPLKYEMKTKIHAGSMCAMHRLNIENCAK